MAQQLVQGKQRTNRVAIRSRMRGKQERIALLDLLEHLVDHGKQKRAASGKTRHSAVSLQQEISSLTCWMRASEARSRQPSLCLSFPLGAPQQLVDPRR